MLDKTEEQRQVDRTASALCAKKCWYTSCGGSAGSTFQLALGEKVPRSAKVANEAHSEEYRRFEGEVSLLVWCTWRLDSAERPVSSSDDTSENIERALNTLVGRTVLDVRIDRPGWDLHLTFSDGYVLRVFCDHVPGDPSFDGNWELFLQTEIISVGVGSKWTVEPRKG